MTLHTRTRTWLALGLALLGVLLLGAPASANEGTPGERIGVAFGFGDGGSNNANTTMPSRPSGTYFSAFSGGDTHSLALLNDGTVLGFGNSADNRIAIPTLSAGQRYTAVAAGGNHSLLLTSAGTIRAIGSNSTNQLNVPTLGAGLKYTAVAAGNGFSVALVSDGTLRAWGFDNFGQVADVPAPQTNAKFISVAAGSGHAIALQDNGQVKTWGRNTETQLQMPVPVKPTGYTAVDASGNRTLALRSDGQVFGAGEATGGLKAPPLNGFDRIIDIALGDDFGLALTEGGVITSFGSDDHGQLTVPFVGPALQISSIDAGARHSLAILAQKPTVSFENPLATAAYGDPAELTVKVTAGSTTPSGKVNLLRSGTHVTSGNLASGQRKFQLPRNSLSLGNNFFYAEYEGDNRTVPGRATAHSLTVVKAKPSVFVLVPTHLTTAHVPDLTLRVEAGSASLDGTMTVSGGTKVLGTAAITESDGGDVQVKLPRFALPGSHELTVKYGGSAVAESATTTVQLPIAKAKSKLTLKLGKPKVKRGQQTKLTGRVQAGDLAVTGKVTVYQGKKKLRALKLATGKNGRFNLKLPRFKTKGKRKFRVEYSGSAAIDTSKSRVTLKVKG